MTNALKQFGTFALAATAWMQKFVPDDAADISEARMVRKFLETTNVTDDGKGGQLILDTIDETIKRLETSDSTIAGQAIAEFAAGRVAVEMQMEEARKVGNGHDAEFDEQTGAAVLAAEQLDPDSAGAKIGHLDG